MTRTIVVSDLHGAVDLLERALEHAEFTDADALVVAGDLIDVGHDDTIGLAESLGAVILVGNHEICAMLGIPIRPQNPQSLAMAPLLAERIISGAWKLAHSTGDWLVTHAGVSSALDDVIETAGRDADSVADALNERFVTEVTDAVKGAPLSWPDLERYRLVGGGLGPLWFRPRGVDLIPAGLKQVVGHTPPEAFTEQGLISLESAGWLFVEPGGHARDRAAFRYAVIEGAQATVHSG